MQWIQLYNIHHVMTKDFSWLFIAMYHHVSILLGWSRYVWNFMNQLHILKRLWRQKGHEIPWFTVAHCSRSRETLSRILGVDPMLTDFGAKILKPGADLCRQNAPNDKTDVFVFSLRRKKVKPIFYSFELLCWDPRQVSGSQPFRSCPPIAGEGQDYLLAKKIPLRTIT